MRIKRKKIALMLQATQSNAGKSIVTAALLRALTRRGYACAPFKPQNMSTNAAVTPEGHEISRAQALQAYAANIEPHYTMNPILLKPQGDNTSHVIVEGRYHHTTDARTWLDSRARLLPKVIASYEQLSRTYDVIVVEGAGSPVEKNLPPPDIANMGFALATRIPVVLIADIESGGVLADIIGTHILLTPQERALVKGYIINKFRGDIRILQPAFPIIRDHTDMACLGVLPFHTAAQNLPVEDSLALARRPVTQSSATVSPLRIVIPHTPHLANSDDIEPLRLHPDIHVCLAPADAPLPDCDLILLLGSKAVLSDLAFIKQQGWHKDIERHHRLKKPIIGLCGGYQLLGRTIDDPSGIEGIQGKRDGLGLLNVHTHLQPSKTLTRTTSRHRTTQQRVCGYEIHIGTTTGADTTTPMLLPDPEHPRKHGDSGAVSPCGTVQGCYMHGLFANDDFRANCLKTNSASYETSLQNSLNALADTVEQEIDIDALLDVCLVS